MSEWWKLGIAEAIFGELLSPQNPLRLNDDDNSMFCCVLGVCYWLKRGPTLGFCIKCGLWFEL